MTMLNPAIEEANAILLGRAGDPDKSRAVALYRERMEAGDANAALRLGVLLAEGTGCEPNWSLALDVLGRAAQQGSIDAQDQIRLLAGVEGASTNWNVLLNSIDLEALLTPPPLERISDVSMIAICKGYAPTRFAKWLKERAQSRLVRTSIFTQQDKPGALAHKVDQSRTATGAGLGVLERDFVCAVLQERAARLCGIPVLYHEGPNVLSYEPGQSYAPHFDFFPPAVVSSNPMLGQRAVTIVTYLDDQFEGGTTRFPRLSLEYRGEPGDAIMFFNLCADGLPDMNTLHEGSPVISGRKWVLSQWIRNRPHPSRCW